MKEKFKTKSLFKPDGTLNKEGNKLSLQFHKLISSVFEEWAISKHYAARDVYLTLLDNANTRYAWAVCDQKEISIMGKKKFKKMVKNLENNKDKINAN